MNMYRIRKWLLCSHWNLRDVFVGTHYTEKHVKRMTPAKNQHMLALFGLTLVDHFLVSPIEELQFIAGKVFFVA